MLADDADPDNLNEWQKLQVQPSPLKDTRKTLGNTTQHYTSVPLRCDGTFLLLLQMKSIATKILSYQATQKLIYFADCESQERGG